MHPDEEPKDGLPPLMVIIQDLQRRVAELEARLSQTYRNTYPPQPWTTTNTTAMPTFSSEYSKLITSAQQQLAQAQFNHQHEQRKQETLDSLREYKVGAPEQLLLDLDVKS